jgi:hypothetical protein
MTMLQLADNPVALTPQRQLSTFGGLTVVSLYIFRARG